MNFIFSHGSGVGISPTEVITAEHVITGASRVDVSVDGGIYQQCHRGLPAFPPLALRFGSLCSQRLYA